MEKKKMSVRRRKKIRNLILICAITAATALTTTFAWFIGMRTVNVSSFDVEIASTDSLLLSFNGEDWDTNVAITEATLATVSYSGHKNYWGGDGLVPVSSIGEMDVTASRMKLYEKASLTASPGGYRLMASRIDNYGVGEDEKDGYVTFDLFVKNFSGEQYLEALNVLDEEAIYLTTNSEVDVAIDGGVEDTGIENSVRVAFAQIGRVIGTETNPAVITAIDCNDVAGVPTIVAGETGICRTAQIWEPNDIDHVDDAIRWYNTSCKLRTGADVMADASFGGACNAVAQGTAYDTYAIKSAITSTDAVDVYDGADYNGYAGSAAFLEAYDFFTDTEKNLTGVNRPTFMTLAPNSITKIRVYIYIEGQDVDNYDFASIGKKISVNFGFTKERFIETDINYDGPSLEGAKDTTNPVITITGDNPLLVPNGGPYDPLTGMSATDNLDGVITADLVVGGDTVDVNVAADYTITYNIEDSAGNHAVEVTRTVTVQP